MKGFILLAMLSLLIPIPTQGWAAPRGATVLGAGTASCGEWIKVRKQKSEAYFFSWVQGYLTATNVSVQKFTSDITATTDPEGLKAWIDNYCSQHPLNALAEATGSLAVELVTRTAGRKN